MSIKYPIFLFLLFFSTVFSLNVSELKAEELPLIFDNFNDSQTAGSPPEVPAGIQPANTVRSIAPNRPRTTPNIIGGNLVIVAPLAGDNSLTVKYAFETSQDLTSINKIKLRNVNIINPLPDPNIYIQVQVRDINGYTAELFTNQDGNLSFPIQSFIDQNESIDMSKIVHLSIGYFWPVGTPIPFPAIITIGRLTSS